MAIPSLHSVSLKPLIHNMVSSTHQIFRWGYLQTGSGVPEDQLPLISRTIDVDYSALICREAFNLTKPADVEYINKLGGFNISYPRLAFIDGEWDPWRAAGVHAIGLPERPNTLDEPYILIDVSSLLLFLYPVLTVY